jgi:hypothetical protein
MPPGSKHTPGLVFDSTAWQRALREHKRVWLFAPAKRHSRAVDEYIAHGLQHGVDAAYKCRVRAPWYRVPLVAAPDLFLVYMANEGPRLIANLAGLLNVNSVHGVYLKEDYRPFCSVLPVAALSTFTLLGSELAGRAYGGGLLKLEPREAGRIPVPSVSLLKECEAELLSIKPDVEARLSSHRFKEAVALVDGVLLISALGLSASTLASLRNGREHLYGRRRKRSQG